MESQDYLQWQMKLEGNVTDADGLLRRAAASDEPEALAILARLQNGKVVMYFNAGLPAALRAKLRECRSDFEFPHAERFADRIRSYGIPSRIGHYRSYVFPASYQQVETREVHRFEPKDPAVNIFGFGGVPGLVYAVLEGGAIASACASIRQNDQCAEAWVFTAPTYRRKGLAQAAVSAWAKGILEENLLPFYSHEADNLPSANLARKMQLTCVFEEICIDRRES